MKLASMANAILSNGNGFLGQHETMKVAITKTELQNNGDKDAEARFSRKKDHPEQAKCHTV